MFNHDDIEDRSEYRAERPERDDADDLRDAALDREAERRAADQSPVRWLCPAHHREHHAKATGDAA